MALMLGILRCESDLVAQFDRQELLANNAKILKNNIELSERLARIETHLSTNRSAITDRSVSRASTSTTTSTTTTTTPTQQDQISTRNSDNWRTSSSSQAEIIRAFPFERVLKASRVYRRAKREDDDYSFSSSIPLSHAWTNLSDMSLSDISVVSVIALPLSENDISNRHHYAFKDLVDDSDTVRRTRDMEWLKDAEHWPLPEAYQSPAVVSPSATERYTPGPKHALPRFNKLKVIVKGTLEADIDGLFVGGNNERILPDADSVYVNSYQWDLVIDGRNIHLDIEAVTDLAGAPHIGLYDDQFRTGDLFMFVYKSSSRPSFEGVRQYLEQVYYHKRAGDVPMMVVDHSDDRSHCLVVAAHEEHEFAKENGCSYCRITKATSASLRDALVHLVRAKWTIEEQEELDRKILRKQTARDLALGLMNGTARTTLRRLRKDRLLDVID